MRIMITGSGGRLGALLYAAYAGLGDVEVIFQSREAGRDVIWHPDEEVTRLPACDVVVGLWGVTSGTPEALAQNTTLAQLTRQVARRLGAWGAVHVSSAGVYGPGQALSESAPTKPMSEYGAAKLAMEEALLSDPTSELTETVVRLANVVGADSLTAALNGTRSTVLDRFQDGRGPIRSYIGASDLLRVFSELAACDRAQWPAVMNVAAPQPIAMEALLHAAKRQITWQDAPKGAVQEVSLDVTRMTQLLRDAVPRSDPWTLIEEWQALETRA